MPDHINASKARNQQSIIEIVPLLDLITGLQPADRLVDALYLLASITKGVFGKDAPCKCFTCSRSFTREKSGSPALIVFQESRPIAAICHSCAKNHRKLPKLIEKSVKRLPGVTWVRQAAVSTKSGTA